jgi:hypothetical protein
VDHSNFEELGTSVPSRAQTCASFLECSTTFQFCISAISTLVPVNAYVIELQPSLPSRLCVTHYDDGGAQAAVASGGRWSGYN